MSISIIFQDAACGSLRLLLAKNTTMKHPKYQIGAICGMTRPCGSLRRTLQGNDFKANRKKILQPTQVEYGGCQLKAPVIGILKVKFSLKFEEKKLWTKRLPKSKNVISNGFRLKSASICITKPYHSQQAHVQVWLTIGSKYTEHQKKLITSSE